MSHTSSTGWTRASKVGCIVTLLCLAFDLPATEDCTKISDCAKALLNIATTLEKSNKELASRVSVLEKKLEGLRTKEMVGLQNEAAVAHRRLNGIELQAVGEKEFGTFGCGGQIITPPGPNFMVGYRDGDACEIQNNGIMRSLYLKIPQN